MRGLQTAPNVPAPQSDPVHGKRSAHAALAALMDWVSFYDFKHSVIYVNARHRDVHYRTIAQDIRGYVPSRDAAVMDYGCGEASSARSGCRRGGPSHLGRSRAERARGAACALRRQSKNRGAAAGAGARAAGRAIRSDRAAFGRAISELGRTRPAACQFRRLLKPNGLFILGDIVPPQFAAPYAAAALLRFGAANGFFLAALGGLVRIFVSDYFKLKNTVGLSHYTEVQALAKLHSAGFARRARQAQYRAQPAADDVSGRCNVIARSDSDEAIQIAIEELDCFASLAMTSRGLASNLHRHAVHGALRLVIFRIQFRAGEHDHGGHPQPQHQRRCRAERAVGRVVIGEIAQIPGHQGGAGEPARRGEQVARAHPFPAWMLTVRAEAVKRGEPDHQNDQQRRPAQRRGEQRAESANGKKLSTIGIATRPAIETPSHSKAPKVIPSAIKL